MRKFLLTLALLIANSALAQTPVQGVYPTRLGHSTAVFNSTNEVSLNAANNRFCYQFVLSDDKTLAKFKTDLSAITSSPAAGDIDAELVADASGFPSGSVIETVGTASAALATGMNSWEGFTSALTAGTRYAVCLRNTNGVPGTNYIRVRVGATSSQGQIGDVTVLSGGEKWGWAFCYSTDSGSTCSTHRAAFMHFRLEFSDGTFAGGALLSSTILPETTDKVYDAREMGVRFTLPATSPTIRVRGLAFLNDLQGTPPAGGIRYRIYTGSSTTPSLVATTRTIPAANLTDDRWAPAYFSSVVEIDPGETVRVVFGAVSGGDSSNYYTTGRYYIDNTDASRALQAFGTAHSTYTTDGTTFTDTNTRTFPFILLLDTGDEYEITAGGTVIIKRK